MQIERSDVRRFSRDAAFRFYRAAIEPDPLTSWAKILSGLLDSPAADFTLLEPSGRVVEIGSNDPHGRDHQEFVERYQFINPLNRFWQVAPEGEIIHFDRSLIDDACRRSEFYARYGEFLDLRDGVCMLLNAGGSKKILVHARLPRQQRAAERAIALFESLRDDLALSLEIACAFLNVSNTMKCVIDSLDQESVGVAILAADGRIENANHSMNALLQSGEVLRRDQGRIAAGSSTAAPCMSDIIRRTTQSGARSRLCYNHPASAHRCVIAAYPAPQAFSRNASDHSKVVLLVTDNSQVQKGLHDSLRGKYGLTAAETRVAERLHDGRTSRQIATEFHVQTNCVRTHLKAIYAKTGTHSQVELLNFLQREKELGAAGRPAG